MFWPVMGTAMRLIQAMGLHRDGSRWGLTGMALDERRCGSHLAVPIWFLPLECRRLFFEWYADDAFQVRFCCPSHRMALTHPHDSLCASADRQRPLLMRTRPKLKRRRYAIPLRHIDVEHPEPPEDSPSKVADEPEAAFNNIRYRLCSLLNRSVMTREQEAGLTACQHQRRGLRCPGARLFDDRRP